MSAYSGLFLTSARAARKFPTQNLRNFAISQIGRPNKKTRRCSFREHTAGGLHVDGLHGGERRIAPLVPRVFERNGEVRRQFRDRL